jgi:hypothetical protein
MSKFQNLRDEEDLAFKKNVSSAELANYLAQKFLEIYKEDFSEIALERASVKDLKFLFDAARKMSFYASTPDNIRKLTLVFEKLKERKEATSTQARTLYDAYVNARMFGAAASVRQLISPAPPDLPTIIDEISPKKEGMFLGSKPFSVEMDGRRGKW